MEQKSMMILGATGSVGLQAVDVAERCGCAVSAISAARNVEKTEELARRLGVSCCAMADEEAAADLRLRLADTSVKVYAGSDGICEMIGKTRQDVILNSIIGEAGLLPTLAALDTDSLLALANKESLVVAGEIVMQKAREKGAAILPVDSEHCAIFQCLHAGKPREVKKLLLTASGGPFFGKTKDELRTITVEQALAHPTWKMGAKITVDSATLMNKGFEIIEAVHLFGVDVRDVQVVVHRESIIHSMVEYIDNSVIAQMSLPDMRHCVHYALTYPDRVEGVVGELDFTKLSALHFDLPDPDTFALLACARRAIAEGGALPAVLNAANEVAVAEFLAKRLSFYGITEVVCRVVEEMTSTASRARTLDEILACDREARSLCASYLA